MTEPRAQIDPSQPYIAKPGEGVDWPTAPLPSAGPTAYGQPGQPIGYGQSPQSAQVYDQPYAQPVQPYAQPPYAPAPQGYTGLTSPYPHPQGQPVPYGPPAQYGQPVQYGQPAPYGQSAPYGQPYPPNIVINNVVQSTAVAGAGGRTKSVGIAFLLTFLFGPLGMFYSTVVGAIVMLVGSLVLVPLTSGIAVFVAWPVSIIWGCVAASRANAGVRVNQTSLR